MVKVKPLVIKIPENTTVSLDNNTVKVVGPKGEIGLPINKEIGVRIADSEIVITRLSDEKRVAALHGLIRALITNSIVGVHNGFTKTLELSGVGFRAQVSGDELSLSIGFSHPVKLMAPKGITFGVSENKVTISGIDKQLVGQVAHTIRSIRPPEPYKGKGIRYLGERIRRKAGKAAAKTAGAK